jgi:hypothetical protein
MARHNIGAGQGAVSGLGLVFWHIRGAQLMSYFSQS